MHGPQKPKTPAYEGKGKGKAMPPIDWPTYNTTTATTDEGDGEFAVDIQRAIAESRRNTNADATRHSSGGGDPGPSSSSSSRASSVSSSRFSSPGPNYSPMSPSTPASSPISTASTRASSPNLASHYARTPPRSPGPAETAYARNNTPSPSSPGASTPRSMTNPVAESYRFVSPASAFARAATSQAQAQPRAHLQPTRAAPPPPQQPQGSWPRLTPAQRAAAGITQTYHKLSPASRASSLSSSSSSSGADTNANTKTPAPTDMDTTPAHENRTSLAVEDEDEDEDAGLEEIHINIPAGVAADTRSVRPPSTRGDDVKMLDFKPFVVTVATTTTAPNTKFTYAHPLVPTRAAASQGNVNPTTTSSNNIKAPPARAAALGSPPAPSAVPGPPSQREVREAMLRRLEEEEEREEAAREERLAAQRRAKLLASRPRWSGLRLPTGTPPPPARTETASVDTAMHAVPVRAVPTTQPGMARSAPPAQGVAASAEQASTHAESGPVNDAGSRTPVAPTQPMRAEPAARPVVMRAAPTPTTQSVAPSHRTPVQAAPIPERVMVPTPTPAPRTRSRVREEEDKHPPRGEPELARRHAALQEEIDAGTLPPLPVDESDDEDRVKEKETEEKEKEKKERESETETETDAREIPSWPARTLAASPPDVPAMQGTAPSPQAEETAVQTGMEVAAEALGIQVDDGASGPVFAGASVSDADVEMDSEEDAQVEKERASPQPPVRAVDIMEQDDGAWTASVYAVFQPALPAYMERRPTSAARPPLATFAAAHTTVVIPPIDNDLAADGMDTKEHAGYLYDTSSELSFCVPDSDIYTCAPVAPAYSAQDVVMQDADTAVEGALSAEDAAVVAAMAGDPELMQLLDEELDAQMAEMAAAVAAEVVEGGWTGVVDEGESEQARAGEVPGVAPSDSQRHAEAPRPAAASLLHAESNDDEEEAQVARPRRAEKGRASHRVHPKHARGSAAPPRERTTRVRAAPTTVRTSASTREPRPARARASASPRAAPPALPTPTPVGADTQARRPTVKLRSGAVVEGGETTPPRAKKTAHPNSWVEDALIDVAAARRHLTETRPPPTPLLRRILSRKVECLKKENPKASIKDLAAKFPGRFTPFDVDRATPSPARPAAAFASTPANKAFGFNFPVGAAKAAAAAPEPSIAAVLPPGPTVSRAAFSTTPPDTAAGASHAPAAQEAPPVVHQTPGPEPAQADADATETSAVEELLAKVAALEVPDLIDFLSPLAVAHESEAQTDDASAPAAHAQAAATQTPPASTPDERAQEALEAEHRPQVKKQTRKQRRAAAAAAVEAVAALDESHDAIRPSNAQRNRVYGHRYRPYPGVAEPASTGREVPGSQAHAAEAPCKVYRPPTPDAAPAPVVVEKVRVKGRPVEMVEEVEEDEEPKVGLAPDGPILVYIGGNVASAAADAPAQDVMVEIEVEIEEPEAVAATKPVETHVEPASHVQPDEAVDSDTDDSADDVSDAGDSDEDVVSEDELDDNFGDARVVMPGDFFFANPPPSNPPALWPLGATIGVVSAVAFVGYRYA